MAPRSEYTEQDIQHLVQYLAEETPDGDCRNGNLVYKKLTDNYQDLWPWSGRHSWQSWRNYYVKHEPMLNLMIAKYLKKIQSKNPSTSDAINHEEQAVEAGGVTAFALGHTSPSVHQPHVNMDWTNDPVPISLTEDLARQTSSPVRTPLARRDNIDAPTSVPIKQHTKNTPVAMNSLSARSPPVVTADSRTVQQQVRTPPPSRHASLADPDSEEASISHPPETEGINNVDSTSTNNGGHASRPESSSRRARPNETSLPENTRVGDAIYQPSDVSKVGDANTQSKLSRGSRLNISSEEMAAASSLMPSDSLSGMDIDDLNIDIDDTPLRGHGLTQFQNNIDSLIARHKKGVAGTDDSGRTNQTTLHANQSRRGTLSSRFAPSKRVSENLMQATTLNSGSSRARGTLTSRLSSRNRKNVRDGDLPFIDMNHLIHRRRSSGFIISHKPKPRSSRSIYRRHTFGGALPMTSSPYLTPPSRISSEHRHTRTHSSTSSVFRRVSPQSNDEDALDLSHLSTEDIRLSMHASIGSLAAIHRFGVGVVRDVWNRTKSLTEADVILGEMREAAENVAERRLGEYRSEIGSGSSSRTSGLNSGSGIPSRISGGSSRYRLEEEGPWQETIGALGSVDVGPSGRSTEITKRRSPRTRSSVYSWVEEDENASANKGHSEEEENHVRRRFKTVELPSEDELDLRVILRSTPEPKEKVKEVVFHSSPQKRSPQKVAEVTWIEEEDEIIREADVEKLAELSKAKGSAYVRRRAIELMEME